MRQYFVYILANRRYGVLYVGVTNDLVRSLTGSRKSTASSSSFTSSSIRISTKLVHESAA